MPVGAKDSGCMKVTAQGKLHVLPKQQPAKKHPSIPRNWPTAIDGAIMSAVFQKGIAVDFI